MKVLAWYQPRGKLPPVSIDVDKKKIRQAVRCVSLCAGVMAAGMPAYAAVPVAAEATATGFASTIPLMLKAAAYGSIASILASAMGQGQIANLLKVATIFSCIGIIVGVIVDALNLVDSLL